MARDTDRRIEIAAPAISDFEEVLKSGGNSDASSIVFDTKGVGATQTELVPDSLNFLS